MSVVNRTSIALQKDTKVELDMIKARLQVSHDEVILKLIQVWEEKNKDKSQVK